MKEQPQLLFQHRHVPGIDDIDVYIKHGGYEAARKALTKMDQDSIMEEVKNSVIRGRGGAGMLLQIKWSAFPKNWDQPHYLIINADEGEPGTAKDRELMNKLPHLLIEGCIISSWAIRSKVCYIYIRGEYMFPGKQVQKAIDQAYAKGFLGKNILGTGYDLDIHVHMGAGSYECGEETALMSSLMGERGMPRHKFPAVPLYPIKGIWDCPSVVNNVETVAALVPIINMSGAEYAKFGTGTDPAASWRDVSKGTKLITVSGHVNKPGNYEIELGLTVREIIDELCGGMLGGRKCKFFIPGGSSAPLLTADFLDTGYAYETFAKAGSMLGSGALIIYDETVSVPKVMSRLMHFYAHESCGKCTPCREGTSWLVKIHDRFLAGGGRMEDLDIMLDICNNMINGRSFCPLAEAAAWPIGGAGNGQAGAMRFFRHEYEALIPKESISKRIFAPLPMAGMAVSV
jgi:NADH-quinone oxidoreductase subunit F